MSEGHMSFEQLMFQGVEAQARGAHEEALWYRQFAYFQAAEDRQPVAQARALRDGAASHSKLDQLQQAEDATFLSINALQTQQWHPDFDRELGATFDRRGRIMARAAIKAELETGIMQSGYRGASARMADAWEAIRRSERSRQSELRKRFAGGQWPECVDQYRVNMAKDRAVIDGLPAKGLFKGLIASAKAAMLGLLSESIMISNTNPNLGFMDRLKSHGRYSAAGLYAGGLVMGLHVKPLRGSVLRRVDALLR